MTCRVRRRAARWPRRIGRVNRRCSTSIRVTDDTGVADLRASLADSSKGVVFTDYELEIAADSGAWTLAVQNGEITQGFTATVTLDALDTLGNASLTGITIQVVAVDNSAIHMVNRITFGASLVQALRGNVPVASFSSINSFNLGLSGEEEISLIDHVLPVYEQSPNPPTTCRNLVRDFGQLLFGSLGVVRSIDTSSYVPANDAEYPNTSYGRRLREIAQLLKEPSVELQLATVDIGGWDTHSSQGGGELDGRMSQRLAEFADGIAALYTDLGSLMGQVVILTMTEFGRTAKQNGSLGTDHGVASCWFAVGGGLGGGIYDGLAGWPGLDVDQLAGGRFLDYTVNHRDIMGDILTGHLGDANLGTVLPGHGYDPDSVGLFS